MTDLTCVRPDILPTQTRVYSGTVMDRKIQSNFKSSNGMSSERWCHSHQPNCQTVCVDLFDMILSEHIQPETLRAMIALCSSKCSITRARLRNTRFWKKSQHVMSMQGIQRSEASLCGDAKKQLSSVLSSILHQTSISTQLVSTHICCDLNTWEGRSSYTRGFLSRMLCSWF